jgi:hypothetical protein
MAQSNFDKLAGKLAARPGVTNPNALAAFIGRNKWGSANMAKAAAKGKPAAVMARKNR